MFHHQQQHTTKNSNRRYSLFSGSSQQTLSGLFSGTSAVKDSKIGPNHGKQTMKGSVCHRCKRFEVDLTNTSDNLTATDEELKASRQVISLLQRQLELFRVEKEGLEKLIISQSSNNDPLQVIVDNKSDNISNLTATNTAIEQLLVDTSEANKQEKDEDNIVLAATKTARDDHNNELGDNQKLLLKLIQTQLYSKDEEIVKLKFNLKEMQNEKERLSLQLHLLEEDNCRLKNENSVLSENLALRDQTIVSLSNEVFEQGNLSEYNSSHRRQSSAEALGGGNNQSLAKAQRHIAKLIDTLDAYKKTNELLSNNVMSLTEKCTKAEKDEIETRSQCQELEAKCCQIQSKLLSLLKEIEQSSKQVSNANGTSGSTDINDDGLNQDLICSESVKLLIKRLLEDKSLDIPLSWKEGNRSKRDNKDVSNSSKYATDTCDELGFYIVLDDSEETIDQQSCGDNNPVDSSPRHSSLAARRNLYQNKERPSAAAFHLTTVHEITETNDNNNDNNLLRRNTLHQISIDAVKSDETRWHLRWDNFIKDFDKIDLSKSKEFKCLLRSGVPQEYRCKVWKALVHLRVGSERQRYGPDYYQSLLEPNRPQSASKQKSLNPSSKQIELDLLRTLPNNRHFETLDSSGTIRLRRVLTAYSEHNPKVGYCQGMNRLAAVALLVLPEEEAFWCLVTIVDNIMPIGYYNDLWLAQVDSSVVMDFVAIKMPNLNDHFTQNGIELSLFAWFLTIFVDGTPPALFLRLWDSFLYEGDKILFRVALALLKMYESQLLRLKNSVAINNFLRSTVNAPMNIDLFFDIAFDWINPLSTKSLRAKRQYNFQQMRTGFEG